MKNDKFLVYSSEVKKALEKGKPVVGLESATVMSEMPYPQNGQTAKKLCEIVRGEGAVPAVVALVDGKIHIGLSDEEIDYIAKAGDGLKKASRADLTMLSANEESALLSPGATVYVAKRAGIKVVSLAGIGGARLGTYSTHPDVEELSTSSVLAFTAGVAPVYGANETLEYIESKGIPTVGYNTDTLPAFYVNDGGVKLSQNISSPAQLAKIFKAHFENGLQSALLAFCPVPENFSVDSNTVKRAIELATEKAEALGVRGRELIPFLSALIAQTSGGKMAEAIIAALCTNARLAAQAAVVLSAIMDDEEDNGGFDPELISYIKKTVAHDVEEELEDEMEEELEESVNKEIRKVKEELRTEITEMLSAYALGNKGFSVPSITVEEEEVAPAVEENTVDDRPFIPFVPGENNEHHGLVKEPAKEEFKIDPAYYAEPEEEEKAPAEEAIEKPIEISEEEATAEETVEAEEPEEEAEEAPATEENTDSEGSGDELTEYDPNAYRKKHEAEKASREADRDHPSTEPAPGATTEYNPEEYRKRAKEKKRRMAIASGEPIPEDAKTEEDIAAEATEMVDCKGPLDFTGEHPLAWKCTRCGQLFEKHEIPHKRPKNME